MPRPKALPPPEVETDLQEALCRYIGKGTHGLDGYRPFNFERMLEVAAANGLEPQMREWREVRQADTAILRMLLGNALRKRRRHGHDLVVGPYTVPGELYPYVPSNGPEHDPYRFRPRNGERAAAPGKAGKPKRSLGELMAELETYPDASKVRSDWTPDDIKTK